MLVYFFGSLSPKWMLTTFTLRILIINILNILVPSAGSLGRKEPNFPAQRAGDGEVEMCKQIPQ